MDSLKIRYHAIQRARERFWPRLKDKEIKRLLNEVYRRSDQLRSEPSGFRRSISLIDDMEMLLGADDWVVTVYHVNEDHAKYVRGYKKWLRKKKAEEMKTGRSYRNV